MLVADRTLMGPLSQRLSREKTRWMPGSSSEAVSLLFFMTVTSCTYPKAPTPLYPRQPSVWTRLPGATDSARNHSRLAAKASGIWRIRIRPIPLSSSSTARIIRVLVSALRPAFLRDYSQRVWRVPDGLPQNRIQAISQTKDGYLWIGTSGGLVRFDGIRFTIFDRSNTSAFRDDSILVLYPSRDGSLWIGAEGGGLLHYDGGTFTVYGHPDRELRQMWDKISAT